MITKIVTIVMAVIKAIFGTTETQKTEAHDVQPEKPLRGTDKPLDLDKLKRV